MKHSMTDIDLGRLEEEWVEQPKLCRKYAVKLLPDAKKDLAEAKAALQVAEAEIKRSIRRNPKKFKIDGRPTNDAVKEAMILTDKYQDANKAVIEAEHAVDVLTGANRTVDHKKKALENLVTLHGQGYFATPRVKGGMDREIRHSIDVADRKAVRKGLRRKKG